jgi:hypothetical protein
MNLMRFAATVAAAVLGVTLAPTPAHADTIITVPFYADSSDNCRYGVTQGKLYWNKTTTGRVDRVTVSGSLTDRPTPADPGPACVDDHFVSTATFTAYAGSAVVGRQARRADNERVLFQFTISAPTTVSGLSRLTIQVCRSPSITLPPSYCGSLVIYPAP